jgi:heat shock protein HslJ
MVAMLATHTAIGRSQAKGTSWLDEPKPASWNKAGQAIPAAPKVQASVDPRCRDQARPPQVDEDKQLRSQGWDLVGPFQGGWQVLLNRGAAGYDGMCRPLKYQDFVFVRGAFAGTLSPQPMDSRTDGALNQVSLLSEKQVTAAFARYDKSDALCCPSKTTHVVFDIAKDAPVVRPVSASTSQNAGTKAPNPQASKPLEGTYWKVVELAGKPTPAAKDPSREAHLKFQKGRVSGSDGCNRVTGSFQHTGDHVTFGQMAVTQMACINTQGTEEAFHDMLNKTARLSIAGDRLVLFDAAGKQLAALVAGQEPAGQQPGPTAIEAGLAGTSWRLVKFQSMDDTTLTPDDRSKYTIEFGPVGQLTARIDCNRGRGTWKSSGPNQIQFGPLALTRAMCPPGSLHDQIVKQWENIRSFVLRDGHLFLAIKMDSGIYEFEPIPKTK